MISLTDLKKTIALARVYNAKACKPTVLNFSNIEEVARTFNEVAAERDALDTHLCSLSYDDILDLEGLMNYGKNLNPEFTDIFAKKHFQEHRKLFAKDHPTPNGKKDAIKYLIAKGPLADYLESAAKALELI